MQHEGCQIAMINEEPCGRQIHAALTYDEHPVCLMHSRDPMKSSSEFNEEIWAILSPNSRDRYPTSVSDFTGFIFIKCNFSNMIFRRQTNFSKATFSEVASFDTATFTEDADFSKANFTGHSIFEKAVFLEAVRFDDTQFGKDDRFLSAIANFRDASFMKPDLVRFLRTNEHTTSGLRVRFVNCRMEGIQLEAVRWYRFNNRMILQDELDILERSFKPLSPSYEEVAIAYRRLITTFEKARAYDLSDNCAIGEFDMKRQNPNQFLLAEWLNPIYERYPCLQKCFGEQLSIVGIYRWASVYGTSYHRALIVLGSLLFIFGLGYSTIAEIVPSSLCTNEIFTCGQKNSFEVLCGGLLHSIETATLQRTTLYNPGSAIAYAMEILEQILVAGQAALLLFALRRRFRR